MDADLVLALLGGCTVAGAVAYLATALVRDRPKREGERSMPLDAKKGLTGAIRAAERSIDITGSELALLCYEEVADALIAKLRENAELTVRILGGPKIARCPGRSHETYERWKAEAGQFNGRFQMRFAESAEHDHFVLVDDGRMLILEDSHNPHGWPRTVTKHTRPYFAGTRFKRYFDRIWREVPTVTGPTEVDCPRLEEGFTQADAAGPAPVA